jgi:hypothetical protein
MHTGSIPRARDVRRGLCLGFFVGALLVGWFGCRAARDGGAARGTTAAALRRVLRGDLDTVVLKTLEKDPARR